MKLRTLLSALLLTMLLVSCKERPEPGELTDYWTMANAFSADMSLQAVFSDRSVEFRLRCSYRDDACTVQVLEPEEIGDLTVKLGREGVSLGLDDCFLTLGEDPKLSPATVFGELIYVWKNGGIKSYGREMYQDTPCLLLCSELEGYEYRTFFNEETKLPLCAEVYEDGRRLLLCEFENVSAESSAIP